MFFFWRLSCWGTSTSFGQVSVEIKLVSRGWSHLCLYPESPLGYFNLLPLITLFLSLSSFTFSPDGQSMLLPSPTPPLPILCWLVAPPLHCFAHMFPPFISWRKTPLLRSQELALEGNCIVKLKWCGRWPAWGCHGNSWIFLPLEIILKWQGKQNTKRKPQIVRGKRRTQFPNKT